ncbi:hypothetical protein SH528x_007025 [Novipirellula sp. SH528]|uniref:hypothetical protein n=1 Tax=Novipirellula sp. SH528 TaxID=3454466 RepID=UPI003FA18E5A
MNTPNSDDASTDSNHDEDDLSDPMVTQNMRSVGSKVTNQVDSNQIAQFVTTIKNAKQQVGEHIITTLQHDDTVAVITTVVVGDDGQQRVVSASLNPARLQQVQELLLAATQEREEEEPCVGFHCLVKPKQPQD